MKKYKLTKTTKEVNEIKLYQIEALKDFGNIKKGEKGGWIEKEDNLSQEGNAWVYDNAKVFNNAQVFDNARVYGNAWVSGNAWVYGDAQIYGKLKLINGYFYHTKQKSEIIEKIENDENTETLCSNPKLGEEEKPKGKKVRIRLAEGNIAEGEIIED